MKNRARQDSPFKKIEPSSTITNTIAVNVRWTRLLTVKVLKGCDWHELHFGAQHILLLIHWLNGCAWNLAY